MKQIERRKTCPIKVRPEEIALYYQPKRVRRPRNAFNLYSEAIDRFWRAKAEVELKKLGYSRKQIDNIWAGVPTSMEEQLAEKYGTQVPGEMPAAIKTDEATERKPMDPSITSIPMTPEWQNFRKSQSVDTPSPASGNFFKAQRKRDMFSAELARRTSGHSLESKPRKEQS